MHEHIAVNAPLRDALPTARQQVKRIESGLINLKHFFLYVAQRDRHHPIEIRRAQGPGRRTVGVAHTQCAYNAGSCILIVARALVV